MGGIWSKFPQMWNKIPCSYLDNPLKQMLTFIGIDEEVFKNRHIPANAQIILDQLRERSRKYANYDNEQWEEIHKLLHETTYHETEKYIYCAGKQLQSEIGEVLPFPEGYCNSKYNPSKWLIKKFKCGDGTPLAYELQNNIISYIYLETFKQMPKYEGLMKNVFIPLVIPKIITLIDNKGNYFSAIIIENGGIDLHDYPKLLKNAGLNTTMSEIFFQSKSADAPCLMKQLVTWQKTFREAGIYHLDLKPENMFFDKTTGNVTVGDFGGGRHESLDTNFDHGFAVSDRYFPDVCLEEKTWNSIIDKSHAALTKDPSLNKIVKQCFAIADSHAIRETCFEVCSDSNKYLLNKLNGQKYEGPYKSWMEACKNVNPVDYKTCSAIYDCVPETAYGKENYPTTIVDDVKNQEECEQKCTDDETCRAFDYSMDKESGDIKTCRIAFHDHVKSYAPNLPENAEVGYHCRKYDSEEPSVLYAESNSFLYYGMILFVGGQICALINVLFIYYVLKYVLKTILAR